MAKRLCGWMIWSIHNYSSSFSSNTPKIRCLEKRLALFPTCRRGVVGQRFSLTCCFSTAKNDQPNPFFPRCASYTRFNKSDDEQLLILRDEQHRTWLEISSQLGRSVSSCVSRYQLLKSEEPINLQFTTEEDIKLKQLVTQGLSWTEIAKQLNKPYAHVCKRRYEDTLKNENRRGEFTAEEDMQIVKLVQQHGAKWSLIAQELGTRTAHQCLLRYERVLRPFLKRGAFREEEDNLLRKLYEKYGPQWSKMEKEMPWRSSVQLRKRYCTLEDQAKRNKNPWTRDEEDKLLALFERHGRKWTEIAKALGTRTACQCMFHISECIERGELKHILTWTKERDQELKDLVELYGKHWVYISRRMKYFSPRECEQRQLVANKRAMKSRDAFVSNCPSWFLVKRDAKIPKQNMKRYYYVCCTSQPTNKSRTFDQVLLDWGLQPLRRKTINTVQVNIGLYCNMACSHCHVESSPSRKETMSPQVTERVLQLLSKAPSVKLVDITGGAPELHSMFRPLVLALSAMGKKIQDRCNLTVLLEPGQEDLVEFLAYHQVDIVASLPCYEQVNVQKQRGASAWEKSIEALQLLNRWGYGTGEEGKAKLHLVYNPVEPQLPGKQSVLEQKYKQELAQKFGIQFDKLYCLTNMPIQRYRKDLIRQGKLTEYCHLLEQSFQVDNVQNVMCRNQIHISYDGSLYDCDFHYAVGLQEKYQRNIWQVDDLECLCNDPIQTASHCFGCTAGFGSSCQGSLQ